MKYLVAGGYKTWAGNLACLRLVIEANDSSEAIDKAYARIQRYKRYRGGADLWASEYPDA